MRHRFIVLVALTLIVLPGAARQTPPSAPRRAGQTPPKLVVLLAVDQFRADYVNTYGHQWTSGLARLLNQGASFPLAAYPYGYTVTCAGHSTIGTGQQISHETGIAGNTCMTVRRRRPWRARRIRPRRRCPLAASPAASITARTF